MAAASHQCLCVCLLLSWALSPHGLALPSHRSPPSGCQWASLRAGVDAGHTGCRGSRQRSPVLDGYPPRGGRAQGGRPRLQGRCPSCRPQVPSSSCGSDVHPHLDRLRPELPAGAWGGAAGGQGPLDGVQSPRRGPGPSMPGSRRDSVAAARRRRARQVWWRGQWGRSFTPSQPWSCRGPCGGLTRRGRCAPGRPPHSPSRGLAIGRAVTAPRKEQWVSLARPRSPGRTASLSQEPWAAQPRVAGTVRGRGRGTASAHVCAAPRGRRVASATPRRSPQPAGQPQCPWLGEGEQSGQSRAEGHCAIARDEGPSPARPGRTSQTRSAREADAEGRARFRGKPMLAAGARALGREVSLCRALSSYRLR